MTDQTREELVRAAETSHQLSVCAWDTKARPTDLAKALELRVTYALEHGTPDGPRIGYLADGVADLERPFLRRRSPQEGPPKTTRRRRASKTASKKASAKKTAAPATTKKES